MEETITVQHSETIKLLLSQITDMASKIQLMNIKIDSMAHQIQYNQELTSSLNRQIHQHRQMYSNLEIITNRQNQQIQSLKQAIASSKLTHSNQSIASFPDKNPALLPQTNKVNNPQLEQTNQKPFQIQQKSNQQTPLEEIQFWLNVILKDQRYHTLFRQGSSILTSQNQEKTINLFFQEKKIKYSQLLYRASEHNFSIKSFHDKCDSIQNTLVFVQTEHNKKIGGFTPLTWQSTQNYTYKKDQKKETFIFSLTNGDKLTLKQESSAIANNPDFGPAFGGLNDLVISKNANKNSDSCATVCGSFMNPNYTFGNQKSLQKFTGSPHYSQKFKIAEWQVWRVEFL